MPDETGTATTVEETTPLPHVTSATEWKRKARARWLITLPSGNVVKVHKPKWDKVFNDPTVDANNILNFSATNAAEVVKGVIPLARGLAPYIIEDPRIGNDDASMSVDDIDDFDLMALFAWARGSATNLSVIEVAE